MKHIKHLTSYINRCLSLLLRDKIVNRLLQPLVMHEPKQQKEGLKEKVEQQGDRIEEIEDNVKSMNESISLIKKDVRYLQKLKKNRSASGS